MIATFLLIATLNAPHDFDFSFGTWKAHVRHLGSKGWVDGDGTLSVRKIWNGKAGLEELEADLPSGHVEGLALRLYGPKSKQWSLFFAGASDGTLSVPAVGEFRDGRAEFYDQETIRGRAMLVRIVYSNITPESYHFEQAFSDDHGRTWETNRIADFTRISAEPAKQSISATDRNKDFDFNYGRFKTHVKRLQQSKWLDYDGTSMIAPVWNGRASLFELEVDGAPGHIEGMGLRLWNPESHQWNLNWANSRDGAMGVPCVGEFRDGRGEFVDQELLDDRAILVRNGFSGITPDSARFEQAFSWDGGKAWETNWIMTFDRIKGDQP